MINWEKISTTLNIDDKKELANQLDMSESTLNRYLNGGREIQLDLMLSIADKLNVDLNTISGATCHVCGEDIKSGRYSLDRYGCKTKLSSTSKLAFDCNSCGYIETSSATKGNLYTFGTKIIPVAREYIESGKLKADVEAFRAENGLEWHNCVRLEALTGENFEFTISYKEIIKEINVGILDAQIEPTPKKVTPKPVIEEQIIEETVEEVEVSEEVITTEPAVEVEQTAEETPTPVAVEDAPVQEVLPSAPTVDIVFEKEFYFINNKEAGYGGIGVVGTNGHFKVLKGAKISSTTVIEPKMQEMVSESNGVTRLLCDYVFVGFHEASEFVSGNQEVKFKNKADNTPE